MTGLVMLFIVAEMLLLGLPFTILAAQDAINSRTLYNCGITVSVVILATIGSLMQELSRIITFTALVYVQPKTRTYLMSFCPCCGIFILFSIKEELLSGSWNGAEVVFALQIEKYT